MDRFRGAATGARRLAATISGLTERHAAEIPGLVAMPSGRRGARSMAEEMQTLAKAARQLAQAAEACHAEFARHLPDDDE
ncbi:hypothetical protein [Luteimonas sp. A478]